MNPDIQYSQRPICSVRPSHETTRASSAHDIPGPLPRDPRPQGARDRDPSDIHHVVIERGQGATHRRRRENLHRLHAASAANVGPRTRGRRGGAGERGGQPHGFRSVRTRPTCASERLCELRRSRMRGGVLQRRHRGGRERGQVRPLAHRPAGGDRLRRRLPRADAAQPLADLKDAPVQGGPRPVRARGLPRPVPERLPRARLGNGARGARARAGAQGPQRRRRIRDQPVRAGRLRGRSA